MSKTAFDETAHSAERATPLPRLVRLGVACALALHCVLAWLARPPGILTGQDDTEYIALAQALRQGTYRELFRVDAPFHYQYPPGYPALLALWGSIFGDGFDALAALSVLASAAALLVLFLAMRRLLDVRLALGALGLLAINPELIKAAGSIMSEPLYMLASLLALSFLLPRKPLPRQLAAAGAAALFAAMTRSAGITLVGAILLHWLLQRRWKLVLVPAIVGLLTVGAWLAWGALDPEQLPGSSYVAEFRSLFSGAEGTGPLFVRAVRSVRWYLSTGLPWNLAMPTVPGTLIDNVAAMTVIAVLGTAGAWILLRRWRPATLYLLAYAFLLTVWLWTLARFLLPLVPLLLCAVLVGADALGRRLRLGRWVPLTLMFVLAVGAGPRSLALVRERMACDRGGEWPSANCLSPERASYFEALRWIDANLAEDDVFLTAKSGALWYYTGRKSVSYEDGTTKSPQDFVPWLREHGAGWVVLASLWVQDPHRLAPLIQANCSHFVLQAAFASRTWVFRIQEAGPDEAAATCAAAADNIRVNEARLW